MAAGVVDTLRDMKWIVSLIDAQRGEAEPPSELPHAADFKLRHYRL